MNEYNERWTREKFVEYRKLKRNGYTHQQLKEHFGDDIWYSGLYNKNANILPWLNFINEIKINPVEIPYSFWNRNSLFYKGNLDYFTEFETDNEVKYILCLMYYLVNGVPTYNVIFSTEWQFKKYDLELRNMLKKGTITEEERDYLKSIFEKETNYNDIYNLMKRISFIILDMYNRYLIGNILSIGDTDNKRKINLYRNIIKDSFENIKEEEVLDEMKNKYYLYKIL